MCLAVAILALRRVPVMVLLHQVGLLRAHVRSLRQPLNLLHEIRMFCRDNLGTGGRNGDFRADVQHLYHSAEPIPWFLVVSSFVRRIFATFMTPCLRVIGDT